MVPLRNLRRFLHKSFKAPRYALKVFIRRLWANIYYRLGSGTSSLPEAITLFLTHRCNLRCKMCGQWGDVGATKSQEPQTFCKELPLDDFKRIVDDCVAFQPNITLFGGEPLLYPHCVELMRYIKQKKLHCLIITNGTLLEPYAEAIVDSGLDELNVSIDGAALRHDQIRGMQGLFKKITGGLKKIQRLKKEKAKAAPLVNIQCTISKYNYLHLEELLEVAQGIGADSLTFHNLIFLEKECLDRQKQYDALLASSSQDWQGFDTDSGIDPELLYEKIRAIISGKHRFSVDFYPNFSHKELLRYYFDREDMPQGHAQGHACRCLSPWIAGYIFPDGEVRPCLNFSYSFGNAAQHRFKDAWNSNRAVAFRRLLKQKKIFPACIRCTELYRY